MAVTKLDYVEQLLDNNGALLNGGLVYTYVALSTTPLATYADATGATPNANPVVLDSAGRTEIWFTIGSAYKVVIKTAAGLTLETVDSLTILSGGEVSEVGSQYVDCVLTYPGGPPAADEWLGGERFTRAVSFPANFSGGYGLAPKSAPTATYVVTIKKNTVVVGTASCSTGAVWTLATTGGAAFSMAAGDYLDFWGSGTADVSIADFGLTLAGTLA